MEHPSPPVTRERLTTLTTSFGAAKELMTAAALATLHGDVDAVERTETALLALNEHGRKDPQPPAPLQTCACRCAQNRVRG